MRFFCFSLPCFSFWSNPRVLRRYCGLLRNANGHIRLWHLSELARWKGMQRHNARHQMLEKWVPVQRPNLHTLILAVSSGKTLGFIEWDLSAIRFGFTIPFKVRQYQRLCQCRRRGELLVLWRKRIQVGFVRNWHIDTNRCHSMELFCEPNFIILLLYVRCANSDKCIPAKWHCDQYEGKIEIFLAHFSFDVN